MTALTTSHEVEQQIRYHEERAAYLDANPHVHTSMDEEEHRTEATRLRAILPTVVLAEQRRHADVKWAEEQARVERVKQRRARWGC